MNEQQLLVYVAGQYTSNPVKNTEHAERVSITLIKMGYAVITPHKNTFMYDVYEGQDGIGKHTWYSMDITMLRRCDAICLMRGWEQSKGAREEALEALDCGLTILVESVTGMIRLANMHDIYEGIRSKVTA